MKVSDRIMKLLEEKREVEINELIKEVKEHPGVIRRILEELRKEGRIEIEKRKQSHKPKKYKLIVKMII